MDQIYWDAWLSELETENEYVLKGMTSDQDDDEAGECFLRDILQDPTIVSSESEAILAPATVADHGGATTNSVVNSQQCASETTPLTSCVLSYGKSIVIPDIIGPSSYSYQINDNISSYSLKPKRSFETLINDEPPPVNVVRGTKKSRSGADATDHIMAERRRRQELTERFIALSATIPGLKKIDKSTILSEAISYVKQLQERVKKLELEKKNKMVLSFVDDDNFVDGGMPSMSEDNSNGDCGGVKDTANNNSNKDVLLPEVKARISDNKQVLIRILCKKQKSIMLIILDELKSLNLNVVSNSVVPFGSSTLDVTVIAQMSEEFSVSVEDIVKSLRMALKSNGDPC